MQRWVSIFNALADETRLRIMSLLVRHGELCVCDIVEVLEIGQSKASRHLKCLLTAGLVADRREAVWVYYRTSPELYPLVEPMMNVLRGVVEARELNLLDRKLAKWRSIKACRPPARNTRPARKKG